MKANQVAVLKWGVALAFLIPRFLFAEEGSNQPYIDQIRNEMKLEKSSSSLPDPYLQSIKKKLDTKDTGGSYIDELKASDPSLKSKDQQEASYSEDEKNKLPKKEEGGAIQAVLEGHSELHARREGKINHAYGARYGVGLARAITSSSQLRDFNEVYGNNYAPDLSIFWEFQPFHSEWFGNIGILGMGGVSYFHGAGLFSTALVSPAGVPFSLTSNTQFQFFSVPITVALDYRFNLFRFLRPYVMGGVTTVGYLEKRDDSIPGSRGHSEGYFLSGGAAVLLDWFSNASSWDLYSSFGIKHYYLTVDYTRISTFTGSLNYTISGVMAGITFEY